MFSVFALLTVGMTCMVGGGVGEASAASTMPDPSFSIQLKMGDTIQEQEQVDAGVVGYISNDFTISSTATESYSIYLQPAEGYSDKLIGEKYAKEINGVGSNVAVGSFASNTWGYGVTDTNNTAMANNALAYSTIPDGSVPIKTVSQPDNGNDKYRLVFAAKIGDDMPIDHYKSQAILSVVGSPKDIVLKDLADITYMQEVTPEICTNTPEASTIGNNQYQLKDSRDQKTYWVAKLKDGNCWMTQNLDLDIPANGLSSTDTDIVNDWNSSSAYGPVATQTSIVKPEGASDVVLSYDPGNVFCNNGVCNPNPANGDKTSANGGHDAYGNYYTWVAATAGTGGEVTSGAASGSICPKGWQLPVQDETIHKAFTNLLSGISKGSDLIVAPYYYTYSGYYGGNSLPFAGTGGGYPTANTADTSTMMRMTFGANAVVPFAGISRLVGYPVRCVAR